MGNRTSKPETPIIYHSTQPAPNTQFTQAFLDNLQGIPQSSSPKTRTTTQEELNTLVSSKVEKELSLLTQQRLTMEKRGADQVRREVDELLSRQQM